MPHYHPKVNIDFGTFRQALCAVDLDRVRNDKYDGEFDLGEFAEYVLSDPGFKRISAAFSAGLTREDGIFFENLDSYLILRLLRRNLANLERDVVWGIHDVIASGGIEKGKVFQTTS